jgi:trans-2-enoyl-CoA reductase
MQRIVQTLSRREFRQATSSSGSFSTLAVHLNKLGSPEEAYKLVNVEPVSDLTASEVGLKFLAAPINPADFNVAQGVYGVSKSLPSVGGFEGVALVEKVGPNVTSFKVGDWVLPHNASLGTWTQSAKADESHLIKVPNDIPIPYAATIAVNPCTAYRLLRDFVDLKPGDVIIQNGANSMVGLAVIQMARQMGVKTINISRSDRPQINRVNRLLTNLGGDVNVTDSYLNTYGFQEIMADLPPCKLALNCVGGEVATNMCRVLAPGGTMVTYGGMSKQPVTVPFDLLTYKQLNLKGFWMSKWIETNTIEARAEMLKDITDYIKAKQLSFFFELHDLDDFEYALKRSLTPYNFRKVVLNLDYPDRLQEHDMKTAEDYEMFEAPVVGTDDN